MTITEIKTKIEGFGKDKNFIFRGENNIEYEKISSTLYREQKKIIEDDKNIENDTLKILNFPAIQKEIIRNIKEQHFNNQTTNIDILTELRHFGGKTNLIDFSKNFLIALFFACNGESRKDGHLICFDGNGFEKAKDIDFNKDVILEPNSKNNRVIFQSSIFVYAKNGFIEKDKVSIITIPTNAKKEILEELRKYYNITTDTIFNDLQGFIANRENFKTSEIYFYIGHSFQRKGENKKAIENYNEAIKRNSNIATDYYNRGLAKYNLKEYEEAILDFDTAIKLKPDDANAYNNIGLAKSNLGQYEEAILDYNKAIKLKPDYVKAIENKKLAIQLLQKNKT